MKMLCKSYPEPVLQIGIVNASQLTSPGAQIGPHIFKKKWGNHARTPGTLLVLPGELLLTHAGQFLSFPGTPGGTPRRSLELFLGILGRTLPTPAA